VDYDREDSLSVFRVSLEMSRQTRRLVRRSERLLQVTASLAVQGAAALEMSRSRLTKMERNQGFKEAPGDASDAVGGAFRNPRSFAGSLRPADSKTETKDRTLRWGRHDLDLADLHIAEAERRVSRQRQLVDRLRSGGHDLAADEGERLLRALLVSLIEFRAHRRMMVDIRETDA